MANHHTERLLRERSVIAEIIQMLNTATDFHSTLDEVIMKVMEVIEPAETGLIFLWDNSSNLLRPSTAIGYDFEVFKAIGLHFNEGLLGQVFNEQKPCFISSSEEIDVQLETISPSNRKIWRQALGVEYLPKHIYSAPISSATQKYGVLAFEVLEGTASFSKQDISLIRDTAKLISLSIEHTQKGLKIPVRNLNKRGGLFQTEWVETISHELGMPLTAIKGYATALLLDEVDWSLEKRQEFLHLIEDECDQIEVLLSDLLNATLLDKEIVSLEPQPLQIPQIAHKIADEMGHRTDKHQLIVDFPTDLPPLPADPRWIKLVFRNLLDNAIKYSPEGGLIVIRGELCPPNLVTHISDQGIGIPIEDLVLIFDKYVRASSLDRDQIPGTGLGLPMARLVVEAHGGRIWANSTVQQGTTFSFSLPLNRSSEQTIGETNESGAHSGC